MIHNPKRLLASLLVPLCALILSFFSSPSFSIDDKTKHSYQSCTIITTEFLTTAQLFGRGIPLEALIESLPDLTSQGESKVRSTYELIQQSDLLSAYSAINSDYAKCAKQVYTDQGKPAFSTREYGYYYCAGENKLRYEIILSIFLKQSIEDACALLNKT